MRLGQSLRLGLGLVSQGQALHPGGYRTASSPEIPPQAIEPILYPKAGQPSTPVLQIDLHHLPSECGAVAVTYVLDAVERQWRAEGAAPAVKIIVGRSLHNRRTGPTTRKVSCWALALPAAVCITCSRVHYLQPWPEPNLNRRRDPSRVANLQRPSP